MHPDYTPRDIERFWSKVDRSGGPDACWLWTGTCFEDGYGRFHPSGRRTVRTHRFAWEITYGPIPDDLFVCHDCPDGDNTRCCNFGHLWLGTTQENTADRQAKGRSARGEVINTAQLTAVEVEAIRERFRTTRTTATEIAVDYGVSPSTIGRILRGVSWSHTRPEAFTAREPHGRSHLTTNDVQDIRRRYAAGGVSLQALGTEYGLTKTGIWLIVTRRNWAHVD